VIIYFLGYFKGQNTWQIISIFILLLGLLRSKSFLEFIVLVLVFGICILRITAFKPINNFVTGVSGIHEVGGIVKEVSKNKIELAYASIDNSLVGGRVYLDFKSGITENISNLNYLKINYLGKNEIYRKENIVLRIEKLVDLKAQSYAISRVVNKIISNIDSVTFKYFNDNAALLKAMVFGLGDDIEKEEENLFRNLGLSHVLVASGANIIMILEALTFITSRTRIKFIRVFEFLIIFIYTLIVGIEGSIIRAFFFFCVNMISRLLGRNVDYFQKIFITVILISCIFPYMIFGLSFLLSLLATLSIQFSSLVLDYLKFKNKFLSNLVTNIIILVVVNILISTRFHTFNITGLVSNILVLFLVEWIVLYGFGFVVILLILKGFFFIDLSFLFYILAKPLDMMIDLFTFLTSSINHILGYKLNFFFFIDFTWLRVVYIGILYIWFILSYRKWRAWHLSQSPIK
jgi:competence protein ComEC